MRDADVVLDTVGAETQQRSLNVLRKGGRLVTIVSPPNEAAAQSLGVNAAWVHHMSDAKRLELLAQLCASGSLRIDIHQMYGLADIRKALEQSATGRMRGKLLVRCQERQK